MRHHPDSLALPSLPSRLARLGALAALAAGFGFHANAAELTVVPLPAQIAAPEGAPGFPLGGAVPIVYTDPAAKSAAELFAASMREATQGKFVATAGAARPGAIVFERAADLPREGYRLTVDAKGARIAASANGGWFYGAQTLLQLTPRAGAKTIPAVNISDAPAYPWRGVMLDVSRYFFSKKYVLRYLDMMAMHKLNVFHWHLVDDCGWRIEIKRYPKLTEIGAFRGQGDARHGGFYTQSDIREIVAYAAARNIEVIPEIEVPAHTLSALCAYPELGCTKKQFEMPVKHSISPEIYCVGKPKTWEFLDGVFTEVAALFPSPWIHIGGDEARYSRWKKCPDCQSVIKEQKLKGEHELQGWATRRLSAMLKPKGKRIVGWSEVLGCGAGPDTGLMVWHQPNDAKKGAIAGHPIVLSYTGNTYFDAPESKLPGEPPAATWIPPVTLQRAYEWDPMPANLPEAARKNILGPNACLWSDQFLHTPDKLADRPGEGTARSEAYADYLTLPRIAALAEVGWTPKPSRNFAGFRERMATLYPRYADKGYLFRVPTPEITEEKRGGETFVSARCPVEGGSVRYTLDGSEPTADSPKLEGSIKVGEKDNLRAITVLPDGKRTSLVYASKQTQNPFPELGAVAGRWKPGQPGAGTPKPMTFDATGLINANGDYEITFRYTGGAQRLEIDGIKILRNDSEVVAADEHHGFTGSQHKDNVYKVKIKDYQTGASFKIVAQVYGDEGSNTEGVVLIKRK